MKIWMISPVGTLMSVVVALCAPLISSKMGLAFNITSNPNTSNLLNAILGETTGLSNFDISVSGNSMAFGLFTDDPFGLKSGVVLSTGNVEELSGVNTLDGTTLDGDGIPLRDLSTNFNGFCLPECDTTTVEIQFDVGDNVEKVFFNYVFGSEEFVEFGDRGFNDSFALSLNGQNLARLSDGQTVDINTIVPNSTDPTSFHPDYINNPAGSSTPTKLDGYTQVLGFEGILTQNARNTLTIQIADVGDNWFDSAVFIQGGTLGTTPPTTSVPEPNLLLGLVGMGAIAYSRKRQV